MHHLTRAWSWWDLEQEKVFLALATDFQKSNSTGCKITLQNGIRRISASTMVPINLDQHLKGQLL